MSADLQGAISSAISSANDKAAQKTEGGFSEQVARDRVSSANSRITMAESKVTRNQGEMAKIDEKLNPPPTKDVDTGGKSGGTKTVVDNDEVKKLNSQKSNIQQALTAAQDEVKGAQETAQNAASDAITQAGINDQTQAEMDSLLSKASTIKNTLSEGGSVEDADVKELIDGFNKTSGELTQDQNKAGILSEAFYEPMAKYLENIGELLKNPVGADSTTDANGDGVDEANLPQANKLLNDAGITDLDQQTSFIDFAEEIGKFEQGLADNNNSFGGEFTQAKFTELSDQHTQMTSSLNDTQKGTGVIKESSDVIGRINAATAGGGDS